MIIHFEINTDSLEERNLLARIADYFLPKPEPVTEVTPEGQTKPVVEAGITPKTPSPVVQATILPVSQPVKAISNPCPKCKTGIIVAKTARASGKAFLGCSDYPKCNWTGNV